MGNGEYTTASAIANWCCLTLVELPTISLGLLSHHRGYISKSSVASILHGLAL